MPAAAPRAIAPRSWLACLLASRVPAAGLLAAGALGCSSARAIPSSDAGTTDDVETALADAQAALDVESLATALAGSLQLGVRGAATADQAAEDAARGPAGVFRPATCVSTTRDAAARRVVHTLRGCTGPWGLAEISGKMTIGYSATATDAGAPALALDVTGEDLELGRGHATLHGLGVLAASGARRTLGWQGETRGTTAAGRSFGRTVQGTIAWTVGGTCVEVDGVATGDIAGRVVESTLTGYKRCRGACAEAGAELTVRLPGRPGLTWVFDGNCGLQPKR